MTLIDIESPTYIFVLKYVITLYPHIMISSLIDFQTNGSPGTNVS